MARAGVIAPAHHLHDLSGGFMNVQGGPNVIIAIAGFPLSLTRMTTYARGFFVEGRSAADSAVASLRGEDVRYAVDTKRDKIEYFESWRVRIGSFNFEYLNDSPGGKDTGPSFGISGSMNIGRSDYLACQERRHRFEQEFPASGLLRKIGRAATKHFRCL